MLSELASVSVDVMNFALVTHRVPAARVRPHLPDIYELQTFPEGDEEFCFVSATCFCNRDFRWAALPYPRHTFNESTYRTYIRYRGNNAVYFFGRYLGTALAHVTQRAIARDTYLADFDVSIDGASDGFTSYVCHATSSQGETSFSVEALGPPEARPPFSSGEEHAQFITYRLDGHFTSTAGPPGHCPVEHPRMSPLGGRLHAGHFELWEELGIVPAEEAESPYSVLIEPGVRFLVYAPRPAMRS